MNLTFTKIAFMHGHCSDRDCPVCSNGPISSIDTWIRRYLTVIKTGSPVSPWWEVRESNGNCYRSLRGDLRPPGYYDKPGSN